MCIFEGLTLSFSFLSGGKGVTGSDENLIFFANLVLAAERMQRISNRDQVHLIFVYYILYFTNSGISFPQK